MNKYFFHGVIKGWRKYLFLLLILFLYNCSNDCVQAYYHDSFEGIVTSKYIITSEPPHTYRKTPTIEITDSHNNIETIRLTAESDTTKNSLWIQMMIGDSIKKKEGLDYLIIKKDTSLTVTLECKVYY